MPGRQSVALRFGLIRSRHQGISAFNVILELSARLDGTITQHILSKIDHIP